MALLPRLVTIKSFKQRIKNKLQAVKHAYFIEICPENMHQDKVLEYPFLIMQYLLQMSAVVPLVVSMSSEVHVLHDLPI